MVAPAVPAQVTEIPGNYITSALWNTQINALYAYVFNRPTFKGVSTAAQSIATGTSWSAVTLTAATTDTEGGWVSSSPTIYTVVTAGRYLIIGNISYANTSSTDTSARGVGIWVSGSPVRVNEGANAPNVGWQGQVTHEQLLSAGATVALYTMQNTGGAINTQVAQAQQQPTLDLIYQGAH